MSLSICRVSRFWLFIFIVGISFQSRAADEYNKYVADLHLHESHQARNPEHVIQYADGENGQLLKSVLNPGRVASMLNVYFQSIKRGDNVPNLPELLKPLLSRYEAPFKVQPRAYETEYLDSLEGSLSILAASSVMANSSNVGTPLNTSTTKSDSENGALMESVQTMGKMTRDLGAIVNRAIAASIRQKIENNLFSAEGAKRALALVDRLESFSKQSSGTPPGVPIPPADDASILNILKRAVRLDPRTQDATREAARADLERRLDARFVISGNEVYDKKTDLTWQRCNYGQTWDETNAWCKGVIKQLTVQAATEDVSKNASGWRLPDLGELLSMLEAGCATYRSKNGPPPIFGEVKPNTFYLTTSPNGKEDSGYIMAGQCFGSGSSQAGLSRNYVSMFRLVRKGR